MPIVINQCSSSKRPGDVAAIDKYFNRTHSAIRDFMMGGGYMAGWAWATLSAAKGLIYPTDVASDYDLVLTKGQVAAWAQDHGARVAELIGGDERADAILFVGSKLYLSAL